MARPPFPPVANFHALSLRDLLEAREAYHVHLAHLDNVVATAVGLYRIRREDLHKDREYAVGPGLRPPAGHPLGEPKPERTLENSVVVPESWPSVIVFVKGWRQTDDFRHAPDQVIPKRLYLPDGRMIPVCVIRAVVEPAALPPLEDLHFSGDLVGGGFPVFSDVQGRQHVGSLGCLVTDGSSLFALTNRHVAGEPGQEVYTMIRGRRVLLGRTHERQVKTLPFEEAYPGWPGRRSYSNLDAALLRVEDRELWTAQVFGIGEIGEPVDLNTDTISLQLIGTPLRAFGAASAQLVGEIQALYYRYKSIGGFDYIADMLIGPRGEGAPVNTRPGDSGTVWFYDPPPAREVMEEGTTEPERGRRAPRLRPIALQWGGHRLLSELGEDRLQFALATSVSTILRVLDVELVRAWNIGFSEYWGKVGHYKVAAKACELPSEARCRQLFTANRDLIAFGDESIRQGDLRRIDARGFVPLADVADLVWRTTRRADAANHFAGMDLPGRGDFAGKTLLRLCEDPAKVDVSVWNRFYESLGVTKRGALPFRAWQIYQDMVGALRGGDLARFVCGAGILAHYVGDACQPLHVSRLHHGRSASEEQVHADYETKMLDRFAAEFVGLVNQRLAAPSLPRVRGGHQAAVAVVQLMSRTIERLPPRTVVRIWVRTRGRSHIAQLWSAVGEKTADCVADGSATLAGLWQSAWKEGNGEGVPAARLVAQDGERLKALYMDKTFLPAMSLKKMESEGLLTPPP